MPGTSGVYTRIPRQRATCIQPAGGRGTPEASANYVAFRVVYAGGAREKRRNFGCLHRQAEAGTSGTTDVVTNEREKGEKVHMRGGTEEEEHLRVCAGSAQLAVTNGRHGRRKKFRSRVLRECT